MNITPYTRDLPPAALALLRDAGAIAEREGYRLFLVGGTVRDQLLGRPVTDLDLVVERTGERGPPTGRHHRDPAMAAAASLAELLSGELGGVVAARSQFGTVKLRTDAMPLDLATARTETYARPGALPTVRPGTIEDDLARRDFTVNALAADLAPGTFGELLDPHGGYDDLQGRLLRSLHPRSFADDATRVLRALRYEARLGLRMTPECEAMARSDTANLGAISGDRIRRELARVFQEPAPETPLGRGDALGALRAIQSSLAWSPELSDAVRGLRAAERSPAPLTYLALLASPLVDDEAEELVRRLNAPARWARVIRDMGRWRESRPRLSAPDVVPSEVRRALVDLEPAAVLAAYGLVDDEPVRGRIERFLDSWRHVVPELRGPDLIALGVPAGPAVGEMLRELRDARLDGMLTTRRDEEALVRARVAPGQAE